MTATRAGCRIRSVRKTGTNLKLLMFQDLVERDRARILARIKSMLDGCDNVAGYAFVAWDNDLASVAELRCTDRSHIPAIAMPEFIKNRLLASKIEEWAKEG